MDDNKELADRVVEAARKAAGLPASVKVDRQKLGSAVKAAIEQVKKTGEVGDAIDAVIAAMRKAAGV